MAKSQRASSPKPVIFCDFDGTITLADVTDLILSKLADPAWREIERLWRDGEIGSRECMEKQLALVTATLEELNEVIDSAPIDPGFRDFVRFVRRKRIPFVVTSDGLDYVIRRVLAHSGFHAGPRNGIHFFSTSGRLVEGRLHVSFPHAASSCRDGCATCKPHILERERRDHWPVIYVGDGLSDRHAVEHADFVYARQPLLGLCREKGIPCRPFNTFTDIARVIECWLSGEVEVEMSKAVLEVSSL